MDGGGEKVKVEVRLHCCQMLQRWEESGRRVEGAGERPPALPMTDVMVPKTFPLF